MINKYIKLTTLVVICLLIGWFTPSIVNEISFSSSLKKLNVSPPYSPNQKQYNIALIYIGCSSCPAANVKGIDIAYRKIKNIFKKKAKEYGYGLTTIGISKELIATEELNYLSNFGSFNEIIIGNNWANTGILKYIYGNISGREAVPQILVTKRVFKASGNISKVVYRGIKKEALIIRKIGPQEIIAWAKENAPLLKDAFNMRIVNN